MTIAAVLIGLNFAPELREKRASQEAQFLSSIKTIQTPEYVEGAQPIWDLREDLSPEELQAIEVTPEGLLMQRVAITFEAMGLMVYRGDVALEWV